MVLCGEVMGLRKLMYSICAVVVSLGVTQYAAASLAAKHGPSRRPPAPVAKRSAIVKPKQLGLPNQTRGINGNDFRNFGPEANDVEFRDEVTYQVPGSQGQLSPPVIDQRTVGPQEYSNDPQGYSQTQWGSYGAPTSNVHPDPWSSPQQSTGEKDTRVYSPY